MRAAEQLAESFASIAHAQGKFSDDLFSDSSKQKLFPTDNSTLDTTHTGGENVVTEDQNNTAGTSTVDIEVTHNEQQTEEDTQQDVVAEDQNDTMTEGTSNAGTSKVEVEVTHNEEQTEEDTQQDEVTEDQNNTAGTSTVEVEVNYNEEQTEEDITTDNTTTGDMTVTEQISEPGKITAHKNKHTVVVGGDHGDGEQVHKKTLSLLLSTRT